MYCEKCGNLIRDGYQSCMVCGAKSTYEYVEEKPVKKDFAIEIYSSSETVQGIEEKFSIENTEIYEQGANNHMCCAYCGFNFVEGEKYCISCGSELVECKTQPFQDLTEEGEISLQKELFNVFSSNNVLAFILKYSWFFVLVYPIFTLMGRFDVFNEIYESISTFTIVLYFIYNIGLLAAYTDKNYLGLFVALILRLINSSILVFQSSTPWQSVFRIAVIIVSALFVYKELMTESQRKDLLSRLNFIEVIRNK